MKFLSPDPTRSSRLKRAIAPDREFAKRAKARFLAAFDARHGTNVRPAWFASPAWIAGVFLFLLAGGTFAASVYAEAKNVPADSPLYGLKRMNERMVLAFAAPAAKLDLQGAFTARRADEITDLESRKPSSTMIDGLSKDLGDDLDESAAAIGNAETGDASSTASEAAATTTATTPDLGNGRLSVFCTDIEAALNGSSSAIRGVIVKRGEAIGRLKHACEPDQMAQTATSATVSSDAGHASGDGSGGKRRGAGGDDGRN